MRSFFKSLVSTNKKTLKQLADADFVIDGLTEEEKEVAVQGFNNSIQKFVTESGGAYVLGGKSEAGIYNVRDVATNEDVLTSEKLPDGNVGYHIKDATKNQGLLKALAESRPAQTWSVRKCGNIDLARIVIAQIGVEKVIFDDSNPLIAAYKDQLKSEYANVKFASDTRKVAKPSMA